MEKKHKIIFFGRKDCMVSKKFIKELKKYSNNVKVIMNDKIKQKFPKNIFFWEGDYIMCFRSFYILPKKFIKKAKIAAINFHPGPPNYRGIGCVNFAILNSEKFYGSTCHLLTKKIDSGKILDVIKFKIKKKDNIESILKKTYNFQFLQLKKILKNGLSIKKIKKMQHLMRHKKWSSKLYTRKELNNLYDIAKNIKIASQDLDKYLRATVTNKFRPFLRIKNKNYYFS